MAAAEKELIRLLMEVVEQFNGRPEKLRINNENMRHREKENRTQKYYKGAKALHTHGDISTGGAGWTSPG